jgi:hypothetical protein
LLAILTVEYVLCLWLVYHAAYDMVASGMIISVVPDSVLYYTLCIFNHPA